MTVPDHQTKLGKYYVGKCEEVLQSRDLLPFRGQVQLLLTSPPFPLNSKKKYGNLQREEYHIWFKTLAKLFSDMLTSDGSIVIELGNAWEDGKPVQSLLPLTSLMDFVSCKEADLRLCQQFVVYNPSRLPSPANWVTIERIRVTDSYTNIWWMAKSDYPKADNRKILRPYSRSMKALLERQNYNAGLRPSEHDISETGFLNDNGGSISHNLIEMDPIDPARQVRLPNVFSLSNTSSNDEFMRACRERNIKPHPARMPIGLAAYFVQFLTDEGDLVLDPFSGSNTTGYAAEKLGRKWLSIEAEQEYAAQSQMRLREFARLNA